MELCNEWVSSDIWLYLWISVNVSLSCATCTISQAQKWAEGSHMNLHSSTERRLRPQNVNLKSALLLLLNGTFAILMASWISIKISLKSRLIVF